MRIGSLFSGGGGGDHGFATAGHQIVFGCEIDPKARAVFRRHHPNTPIYHDIREVTLERLQADGIAVPDMVFGGSPCQDLSIAGGRAGLGGERSGLFTEQCRIADELATPWVCWENVVGALSSNRGADFAAVLEGITGHRPEPPKRGWQTGGVCVGPKRVGAWRVLDAQNFGVPQRRRRVFVVAGPGTLARRVVEVLFEPESFKRDSKTRGRAWEDIAAETAGRAATSSTGELVDTVQCITEKFRADFCVESYVYDVSAPMTTAHTGSRLDLETESFVLENAEPLQNIVGTLSPGAHGLGASTVNGQDAYTGQLVPVRVWSGSAQQDEIAAPLLAEGVGRGLRTSDIDGATWVIESSTPSPANSAPAATSTTARTIVRRLTPLECERLMGWPDGWTEWGVDDGGNRVEIANTHRYRICGNGIVSNVTQWIGERLELLVGGVNGG